MLTLFLATIPDFLRQAQIPTSIDRTAYIARHSLASGRSISVTECCWEKYTYSQVHHMLDIWTGDKK